VIPPTVEDEVSVFELREPSAKVVAPKRVLKSARWVMVLLLSL
jgi:hypothetical protein